MKKITAVILCLLFALTTLAACGSSDNKNTSNGSAEAEENTSDTEVVEEVDFSKTDTALFTDRDSKTDYDESDAIKIELNGSSAKTSDNSVEISGSTVTITKDATHIISGTLSDGMIIVDAPDTAKLQLVLNGVDITSKTSAPLYIKQADKVFVTLVGNNTLTSGDSFTAIDDNNIDGTVFSKQDLTFNGNGSLSVSSPAGHGIVGKDDLVFVGGTYVITSAAHGIQANDSVRISSADISADTGKDGIHAENSKDTTKGFVYINTATVKIESESDGISSSSYIRIDDGNFEISAGGGYENGTKKSSDNFGQFGGGGGMHGGGMRPGSRGAEDMSFTTTAAASEADDSGTSMKGIKSGNSMLISSGVFTIDSADDSIHSNLSATVTGGTFTLASGDDAIHAEDTLTITNGKFDISTCYEGLEALHIKISGGDVKLKASDDGLNAAGGTDNSGMGGRDEMFDGGGGMHGGGMHGGGMSSNSNGSIVISGGTLYINASGDGIDANGTLEITDGHTTVIGPTQGDTATLDYDTSATITGGTFIGTGASNMAQTFSSSDQGVIALSVGSQPANTQIVLKDTNGKEIISYSPELSYQVIIISTPQIKSGEAYTITVGSQSGEFEAN